MGTATEIYWDPYDTELDDDPYPVWKRMRDEAPVWWNDRYGFFAVSRYADVEAAHRDPATFSSSHGTVLELMDNDMSGTGQIIFMDPPEHTIHRSLVSRAFTPRRMSALEDWVRVLCADLLDGLADRGEFDYIQDFAAQVPSRVISQLVGVPEADREEQRHHIDGIFHIEPGVGMINDTALTHRIALYEYLRALVERRLADPTDDLISVIAHSEIDDEHGVHRRLTPEEITDFTLLLFTAGTETVMRLLGNAAVLLGAHPDQRADLAANPDLVPNAVEELLRFEPPSPVQGRWTLAETTVAGVTIPARSKVLLLTGSAGRDERQYPDPDRFDVRREFKGHVSFGYGIHFCVGASLARLEGRIAIEETLKRFPEWQVVPDKVVRQHTSTVRGYSEVVVRV